jgi:hypothetical protein
VIRPWYCSRLFWLGLPGLVFLLWIWLAKVRTHLGAGYSGIISNGVTSTHFIGSSGGEIIYATVQAEVAGGGFYRVNDDWSPTNRRSTFPLAFSRSIRMTSAFPIWRLGWRGGRSSAPTS